MKFKQIFYRIYYSFHRRNKKKLITFSGKPSDGLILQDSLYSHVSYIENNTFIFLNKPHAFDKNIDWNYAEYGALWTYNLNYFEFLHQPGLSKETGLRLINDYITQYQRIKMGYDSYPLSLRNIFWIRFLSKQNIKNERIDSFLYDEYKILSNHLEYHLLGNHLLENAFSILFGACYFHDEKLYRKAYKLLKSELNEQIGTDGGHFELSPMYHQIILYRLLDCVNLLSNNPWKKDDLLVFISKKASLMLSWLINLIFPSGNIPYLNDASKEIAPSSFDLLNYSKRLKIRPEHCKLSDSNYRIFEGSNYKCIIDAGGIAPKYQPGHAHADTFNFVLEVNNRPVIVDTGCSTYEQGTIRLLERGTASHNTVVIDDFNSSQVWSSHRVGSRAKVIMEDDTCNKIKARHDGYSQKGKIHYRTFIQESNAIQIVDEVKGTDRISKNKAYFHLDNSINTVNINDNSVDMQDIKIVFEGFSTVYVEEYEQAIAFNQRVTSKCICVEFSKLLKTSLLFKP